MVGHSGDFDATVKAIQCLDHELERLYKKVIDELDGTLYIMADHGNAEDMWDSSVAQPRTAHTTNKVPFVYISKQNAQKQLSLTELSDIAPFILEQLGLNVPPEMKRTKE